MTLQISPDIDWASIAALRHDLHAHPERSGAERRTKKRLMAFIRKHTRLTLIDRGSWFSALYTPPQLNGQPPIAFRADMDALPMPETIVLPYGSTAEGTAHKCGHDGHAACLAALALMLERDTAVRRPVYLIFQSAEETGAGGKPGADFIEACGVSEVYTFHNLSGFPENAVMVRDTVTQCASCGLSIRFIGLESHAGTPELGRNPASALARMALYAESLAGSAQNLLISVVGIQTGGPDFGLCPGTGEIHLTLRADDDCDLLHMRQALIDEAGRLAEQSHLETAFTISDPFPATVNTPLCAAKVRRAARSLGLSTPVMAKPWRPSEDFGWYLKVCPGAMFYVGNGEAWPAPHHPKFDFNDRILKTAPAVFLKLAET